jgi:hypothetical protein
MSVARRRRNEGEDTRYIRSHSSIQPGLPATRRVHAEGPCGGGLRHESIQPAPDGTRYEGYDVNLAFWQAMAGDRVNRFEVEDTFVVGDRANIRWRFHSAPVVRSVASA